MKKPPTFTDKAELQGPGLVRAVGRAFQILSAFQAEQQTLTLSEAARAINLPVSTASRLLATLEAQNLVRRLPDGRYTLGGAMLRIGAVALHGVDLYDLSQTHLERLAEATGETANLGLPHGDDEVLYVRQVLSRHSVRHAAWIGRSVPVGRTAIGAAVKGRVGPQGYCLTRTTLEPDVTALAAPIFNADGHIVGALSVTGPSYRMDDAAVDTAASTLLHEAAAMSLHLGATR
ncbi:IclR family transcriptional regulator [Roseococcus pinisoli]|uniref:IclR family transcriptional regulator n=1 Tax=Roseococcus pinisoli TaxID=2835040 RepID=A0ABS5QBR4_9PROT|nr:IclR family transcriptional regulator [Roseococcus pinisoli]MBS7810947.1 IclR family transcriptional regulator [Roseococcus pinisoli]